MAKVPTVKSCCFCIQPHIAASIFAVFATILESCLFGQTLIWIAWFFIRSNHPSSRRQSDPTFLTPEFLAALLCLYTGVLAVSNILLLFGIYSARKRLVKQWMVTNGIGIVVQFVICVMLIFVFNELPVLNRMLVGSIFSVVFLVATGKTCGTPSNKEF